MPRPLPRCPRAPQPIRLRPIRRQPIRRPDVRICVVLLATLLPGALLGALPAWADHEIDVAAPALVDAIPKGPSVATRLEEIRRRVHDALEYPPVARAEALEGEVYVGFEIDADFRPRAVETVRSSGHPLLDHAARAALSRAAPLPYVHGRLVLPVRFDIHEAGD